MTDVLRRRWLVRLPIIGAAAASAAAAALAGVAGNAATGSAPDWLPMMGQHPLWWLVGSVAVVTGTSVFGAWAQRQREATEGLAADEDIEGVALRLARGVRAELRAVERLEQIHDPWPMPVRLAPASPQLTDHSHAIRGGASDGTPATMHAEVSSIVAAFVDIPSRRMVLLGSGGAGKTVAARRLAADLADLYQPGDAIPVLARLSSWHVGQQDFVEWLEHRIVEDHPSMARRRAMLRHLLDEQRILPILDGLDEIPGQYRPRALARINEWLTPGQSVVLTCRSDEFTDAVDRGDVVSGAAVMGLQPLDEDTALDYLMAATPPAAAERWGQLQATAAAEPLRQVLRSPLYLAMARALYGHGRSAPADLVDPAGHSDRAIIERTLMSGYVERALDQLTGGRSEFVLQRRRRRIRRWLQHLADWSAAGEGEIAWWDAPRLLPRPVVCGAWALLAGALTGMLWMAWFAAFNPNSAVLLGGTLVAVAAATVAGCVFCLPPPTPAAVPVRLPGRRPGPALFVAVVILSLTAVAAARGPSMAYRHVLDLATAAYVASWLASPTWLLIVFHRILPHWSATRQDSAPLRQARWLCAATALGAGVLVYAAAAFDGWGTLRDYAHLAVVATGGAALVTSSFATAVVSGTGTHPSRRPGSAYRFTAGTALCLAAAVVVWWYASSPSQFAAVMGWLTGPEALVPEIALLISFPVMAGRYLAAVTVRTILRPHRIVPSWERLVPSVLPRLLGGAFLGYAVAWLAYNLHGQFEFATTPFIALAAYVRDPNPISFPDPRFMWLGAFVGAAIGMMVGIGTWSRNPADSAELSSPRAVLRADRVVAATAVLIPTLLAAAAIDTELLTDLTSRDAFIGWSQWFTDRDLPALSRLVSAVPNFAPINLLSMLLVVTAPALLLVSLPVAAAMVRRLAWPHYQVARLLLALSGRMPWRFFAFMEHAHRAGMLRQVGGVYQLRHARLAEYLRHLPADLAVPRGQSPADSPSERHWS